MWHPEGGYTVVINWPSGARHRALMGAPSIEVAKERAAVRARCLGCPDAGTDHSLQIVRRGRVVAARFAGKWADLTGQNVRDECPWP